MPREVLAGELPTEAARLRAGTTWASFAPDGPPIHFADSGMHWLPVWPIGPLDGERVRVVIGDRSVGVAVYVESRAIAEVTHERTFIAAARADAGHLPDERTAGVWVPPGTYFTDIEREGAIARVGLSAGGLAITGFVSLDAISHTFKPSEDARPKRMRPQADVRSNVDWLSSPDGTPFLSPSATEGSLAVTVVEARATQTLVRFDDELHVIAIGWVPASAVQTRAHRVFPEYSFENDSVAGDLVRPGPLYRAGSRIFDRPGGQVVGALLHDRPIVADTRRTDWVCFNEDTPLGEIALWLHETSQRGTRSP